MRKCTRCGKKITIDNFKVAKKKGYRRRTNYPFGRKGKSRTTVQCPCGGILWEC